jgi:hypothetical protein
VYDFKVQATDQFSGITNSSVSFRIKLDLKATSIVADASFTPLYTYQIGQPARVISLPSYSFSPATAVVGFTQSLIAAPYFVVIFNKKEIRIEALYFNDAGSYTI